MRDRRLAVLGQHSSPAGLALSLRTWTDRVIAFTNGRARVRAAHRRQMDRQGISLHVAPIERVTHEEGRMTGVLLATGELIACDALFFTAPQRQQCELARTLGCEFTRKGTVKT